MRLRKSNSNIDEANFNPQVQMTGFSKIEIEDDRTGMSLETFKRAFLDNLYYLQGVDQSVGDDFNYYMALSYTVRDRLMHRWISTQRAFSQNGTRAVYYLSAEYLLGKQLANNLLHIGCWVLAEAALKELNIDLHRILQQEVEPGLGNGGLGRLATCYLDSMATLGIPAMGYGIRYEFGIFQQKISDGWQVEHPDRWLLLGNPWEIPRPNFTAEVKFGGYTESVSINGKQHTNWVPGWKVIGVPFDTLVPGYHTPNVNTLCLWSAKASEEFDFKLFNYGDYTRAVAQKTISENISKVLYPNDNTRQGQELRLQQEYFFVSCSLQDIIRTHLSKYPNLKNLQDHVVVQLNDTHPAIAVVELMRLLIDEHSFSWDDAWYITERTCAFTNHTLMPEALERWSVGLFASILPRHLEIIYEINRRFIIQVENRFPTELERVGRLSIFEEGNDKKIRMANLACVGSFSINGVAALHTKLVKSNLLPDFYAMWPEKFNNKTNGVTPRRWLLLSNPRLALLITSRIGKGWVKDLEQLKKLEEFIDDPKFLKEWQKIKLANKADLAHYARQMNGQELDPNSIFDIQVKRFHEYKRQLLNVMHIITLYNRIKYHGCKDIAPRTFIFAGKSAPGYYMSKLIIKLICSVADVVNNDLELKKLIQVIFLENFCVTLGEKVYPAADLSEQISTAGMEASGTGNMKFAMNGALTIGTYDGANIEIREAVGPENFFLFGNKVEEVRALQANGYSSKSFIENNSELQQVVSMIASGYFNRNDRTLFQPIIDYLYGGEMYMLCADYQMYLDCQEKVSQAFMNKDEWARMSIRNTANSGRFSSDRSIAEYCKDIWKVDPLEVKIKDQVTDRRTFLDQAEDYQEA